MSNAPKDLAVVTGTYTDRDGNEKKRYENIGKLMTSSDGSQFILLKRTFNPAGVSVDPGRDMIAVSIFEPRDSDRPRQQQSAPAPQPSSDPAPTDDIPF